ncbi:hypothetical protein F383_11870 [Gossypium arboreum]|uniref:Uncharacterized protein n=1 Tax=Gossypium arboreum TaxID=29729 RepID=A0A0B0MDT4_GOSAR|nr:hypothetical protein F383_15533 [Gossypium arboreum]KHG29483.1 hypothetical protein F383_11870 [Gossypium arboreum]
MTTTSCQDGSRQTSLTPKSRNNNRKAPLDWEHKNQLQET